MEVEFVKAVADCDITEIETEFGVDAIDFDKILNIII
jgi:hypothetical protein